MWQLQLLDAASVQRLYSERMTQDFPEDERPPVQVLSRLVQGGAHQAFALTDGAQAVGYAIATRAAGIVLITHLAILPGVRGAGHGSRLLDLLQARYADAQALAVEVERPEDARDEADHLVRARRVAFYARAGYVPIHALDYRLNSQALCLFLKCQPNHTLPAANALRDALLAIHQQAYRAGWNARLTIAPLPHG